MLQQAIYGTLISGSSLVPGRRGVTILFLADVHHSAGSSSRLYLALFLRWSEQRQTKTRSCRHDVAESSLLSAAASGVVRSAPLSCVSSMPTGRSSFPVYAGTYLDQRWTLLLYLVPTTIVLLDSNLPTLRPSECCEPDAYLCPCSLFVLQRLAQLDGAEVVSRAENKGNRPDYLRQLDDACSAPSTLKLKVGAQVSPQQSCRH